MNIAGAISALDAIASAIGDLDKNQLRGYASVQMAVRYNQSLNAIRQHRGDLVESLPSAIQFISRSEDWPPRTDLSYADLLARCREVLTLLRNQDDPKQIGFSCSS